VQAAPRLWEDPRFLWSALALLGLLLVGSFLIALLSRWRKRADPQSLTANDQLAHFRELYEKGELSQTEFERIRAKLAGQLLRELNLPPPRAEPGPQPPPPTEATGQP